MSTLSFFKEICKIPRESGNEKEIAEYVVRFAIKRGLDYSTDNYNNVIIKRYIDDVEPIILQCHLDMVCEKDEDYDFDFSKDGIKVIEKDGYLMAEHTSLGADNGVGIAQILNILDTNTTNSIEAIFTVSEETTMIGSLNIDLSSLKGKKMINLDGFNSDSILIESASFTDIDINYKYNYSSSDNNLYKISLTGLDGGHSGFDIDKNKGNSIRLLCELLNDIKDFQLADFVGGTKINVIPSSSYAIIKSNIYLGKIINKFKSKYKKEYPNIDITISNVDDKLNLLSIEDSIKFIDSINDLPHGILYKNKRGITTSINLAYVNLKDNIIRLGLRSSIMNERENVLNDLNNICSKYNYKLIITGFQDGFITDEDSILVKELVNSYYKEFNSKPIIESVHISVEVGIIKNKIPNLEVAIISSNIEGAHTTNERVEIESINKCDRWLNKYLDNILK